jgi:predicted anti-sigma-YlaC factor YlaD
MQICIEKIVRYLSCFLEVLVMTEHPTYSEIEHCAANLGNGRTNLINAVVDHLMVCEDCKAVYDVIGKPSEDQHISEDVIGRYAIVRRNIPHARYPCVENHLLGCVTCWGVYERCLENVIVNSCAVRSDYKRPNSGM